MSQLDWLLPEITAILKEKPIRFWLSYQIVARLKRDYRAQWKKLIEQCGRHQGRGAGEAHGSAKAVSLCLQRVPTVEKKDMCGYGLRVGTAVVPNKKIRVFRWIV